MTPAPQGLSVATFGAGCRITRPRPDAPKHTPPVHRRGRVRGFSAHARARFREKLVSADYSGPVQFFTLTVPGIDLPAPDMVEAAWHRWTMAIRRLGCYAVWLREVQKRGAPHWHILLWADSAGAEAAKEAWHRSIRRMGPYHGRLSNGGRASLPSRMDLPGAMEHAVEVTPARDGLAGILNYFTAPLSRSKYRQSLTAGRCWGEICKRTRVESQSIRQQVQRQAQARFLRAVKRLYARSIPADCVFGRKIGRRANRRVFWSGCHTLFGMPDAVRRLAAWASSQ